MDLRIAVTPPENFRIREIIPLGYCSRVKRFAKPYLYKSSFVNYLYQERNEDGIGLVHMVFYVTDPVLLIATETSPRTVVQYITTGHMEMLFKGQKSLLLQPGGYDILQLHTDEYAIFLQRGKIEVLRFEFEESVMKTVSKSATVKQWLDALKSRKSAYYSHRPLDERLFALQEELQYCPCITDEDKEWFEDKLTEALDMVSTQSVLK